MVMGEGYKKDRAGRLLRALLGSQRPEKKIDELCKGSEKGGEPNGDLTNVGKIRERKAASDRFFWGGKGKIPRRHLRMKGGSDLEGRGGLRQDDAPRRGERQEFLLTEKKKAMFGCTLGD